MPTTTRSEIEYTEIVEGYRESWRTNGNESTRILECAWDERIAFMYDILGFSYADPDDDFKLKRHLPEKHPDMSSEATRLYAISADLMMGVGVPDVDPEPYDANNPLIRFLDMIPGDTVPIPSAEAFGRARYAVTYRARPYEVLADENVTTELDRFVERRQTYASENLPIPPHGLLFASDGEPLQEAVAKLLFTKELTYIWYEVPDVPETNIENCLGKLNNSMFDGRYPAQTLLFVGPEIIRTDNAAGDHYNYTIAYKFIYRKDTWNVAIRPGTGGFEALTLNPGPVAGPYGQADFASLFDIT